LEVNSDVPKDDILETRYAAQLEECKLQLKTAFTSRQANAAEVLQYESEVIKVIRGESKLTPDLLNAIQARSGWYCIPFDRTRVESIEIKGFIGL
jgi:hypothetical protein